MLKKNLVWFWFRAIMRKYSISKFECNVINNIDWILMVKAIIKAGYI